MKNLLRYLLKYRKDCYVSNTRPVGNHCKRDPNCFTDCDNQPDDRHGNSLISLCENQT